jgi:hypothetical protein
MQKAVLYKHWPAVAAEIVALSVLSRPGVTKASVVPTHALGRP